MTLTETQSDPVTDALAAIDAVERNRDIAIKTLLEQRKSLDANLVKLGFNLDSLVAPARKRRSDAGKKRPAAKAAETA